MRKRRSHGETALCILGCLVDGPLKVSKLMESSRVTQTKMTFHTDRFIELGLVVKDIIPFSVQKYERRDMRTKYEYRITQKGKEVLIRGIRLYWELGLDLGIKVDGIRKSDVLE